MQVVLQDLRFAFRQIIRNPAFSLTAILSLTLGIGATVAVYSILYDAVLHPWPYAGIERICDVWLSDNAGHEGTWNLTGPQIRQLRQTHAVEDVVVSNYTNQTVTGSDVPDDVVVDEMSGSHFQFLGYHLSSAGTSCLRCPRWAGSSACSGFELQVLAAALPRRSLRCRKNHPA